MKNIKAALIVGILFLTIGCQEAYDWCTVHLQYDSCSILLPPNTDPEPPLSLAIQATIAGGAGNSRAVKDECDYIFTNQQGCKIYYCSYKKEDYMDEWITSSFSLKDIFTGDQVEVMPDTIYPVVNDTSALCKGFEFAIDFQNQGSPIPDSLVVYGGDQHKLTQCGTTNWNALSVGASAIKIAEYEDWAETGDTVRWTW